jgi:predicted transcriptional regulator
MRRTNGQSVLPKKIPIGSPPFTEKELQATIANHPEILPVSSFDPLFGPAICIGREIQTDSGPIDNLYVSPNGYLTLVETKLWKSPEARRQVVAQIIDYTQHIVRWSYTTLEEKFLRYAEKTGIECKSLFDHINEQCDDVVDEAEFIDAVTRCLRRGRLLLLIVGDGIRDGVDEMASYLQKTPNLQFTLGLVEIACYEIGNDQNDNDLLMVPRVVAKTAEITRAIVQIEMSDETTKSVKATTTIPKPPTARTTGRVSKEEFYDLLSKNTGNEVAQKVQNFFDDLVRDNDSLYERFTPNKFGVGFELADGGNISILLLAQKGAIRTTGQLYKTLESLDRDTTPVDRYYESLGKISSKFLPTVKPNGDMVFSKTRNVTFIQDILGNLSAVKEAVDQLTKDLEA